MHNRLINSNHKSKKKKFFLVCLLSSAIFNHFFITPIYFKRITKHHFRFYRYFIKSNRKICWFFSFSLFTNCVIYKMTISGVYHKMCLPVIKCTMSSMYSLCMDGDLIDTHMCVHHIV